MAAGSSAQCSSRNMNSTNNSAVVNDTSSADSLSFLSIIHKGGKLGSALYDFNSKVLSIYEETADQAPQFFMANCIVRECEPKYILTFGASIEDEFIKALIDVVAPGFESDFGTGSLRSLPPNIFLLPVKEYNFEMCKVILNYIPVTTLEGNTDNEREIYIHSHVDFDQKLSVHAAGMLAKYLDKNWARFLSAQNELQFVQIVQTTMRNHLLVDKTTMYGLQVFQRSSHEASFKRGVQSSSREGLSIFKLFSSECKSSFGQACLKNMLACPTNDLLELGKRHEFINLILHPAQQNYVENLESQLNNIAHVQDLLLKVKHSRAKLNDWHILYKSLNAAVCINSISKNFRDCCAILKELKESVSNDLKTLENTIREALDFTGCSYARPTINKGIDPALDAKKLQLEDAVGKYVKAAADVAAQQLPDFLTECAIMYLPEMGYLITIKEWDPDCDPTTDLQSYGYQFMFNLQGTVHYKNPLCRELDEKYGDINAQIIAHEVRILHRLAFYVKKYNKELRTSVECLGKMDALMSMAKVAHKNNYVRPSLNDENVHEIEDCRHPILELSFSYQSNHFRSKNGEGNVKIITGPNGSGKTIYLKQVALAIYLAHVGSFVPAKRANIGMLFSMHTRIHSTESISVRLSSFMIDFSQATQAMFAAKCNSLVLLDEFGRGTTENDGFAILKAFLDFFIKKPATCPHILVATHFYKLGEFLTKSPVVQYLKMKHIIQDDGIFNMFKIEEGVSRCFALEIAAQIGLDEDILQRAREIRDSMNIAPCADGDDPSDTDENLADFLHNIEIPECED